QEMDVDLKYVESLEKNDDFESDKAEFSNIELKKLLEKCKGKYVETKLDKPSVVRQLNAQRIIKPSVLGKLAPFSDSLERKYFSKKKSVLKTNVSEGTTDAGYNVFANDLQHSEQSESLSNTCLVETDDSNVIPDSPDMCEDAIQNDQNDVESDDERVALANLIANLKLNIDENKKIQKQLKKASTTLAQELKECKAILAETSKSLRESISVRDSCLVAFQTKQAKFEKYKAFNDRTIDYDKLECKLNETLGQLALKDIEIKEGLKTKAYEILVVKQKHDELMKQSLLTKSHYEGLVKQKTKVITDLKHREEHDIDKILSMEKQLKFLNEIIYKRSQSIQTIHLMLPKVKECDCLAQKLSKQTESVSKKVHTELLQRVDKVQKHLISLEIALHKCKEQTKLVPKANVSEGLSKPVTAQTLPQTARQAVSNTNVLKPGMYRIDNMTAHTVTPPKMRVAAEYCTGALLHNMTATDT
nr:hypothetical protein [Tanacetum cinerariifolium]